MKNKGIGAQDTETKSGRQPIQGCERAAKKLVGDNAQKKGQLIICD